MNQLTIWAVLCAAFSVFGMHMSDEEPHQRKSIEMTNFAAKPPATSLNASHSRSSNSEERIEYKPVCIGNMNKKPTGLYSHIYTLTSVEKK